MEGERSPIPSTIMYHPMLPDYLLWIFLAVVFIVCYYRFVGPDLSHIPTASSSYWDSYRFMSNATQVLQDGYHKFRGETFKVALPGRWQVVITSPQMIDEMRLAKEEDLSLPEALAETIQSRYTVGRNVTLDRYHVDVVRAPLTRSLALKYDEVYEEIAQAVSDLIPANEKEWLAVPMLRTIQHIICRTTNRLFIGLPVCRDPEWIELNIQFAIDVFWNATIMNLFPSFLKPAAGKVLSPQRRALRIARKYLQEEVERRIEMDDQYGKDHVGRPNDLISWLLEYAKGEERTVDNLIRRILLLNVAAIHTSASSLTQALYNLAAYPEYILPMREEVSEVVEHHGWSKASLGKMRKVDSFLKESSRFEGISTLLLNRKVMNPAGYVFQNGLYLPYGAYVGAPTSAIHHDAEYHENPFTFNGFRFSKMRDDDGEGVKHQMVATRLDYLNFGHGKHACPGRFFAVNELKTILAHLLMTYDIALEDGVKPSSDPFGQNIFPDPKARLLFRHLPE